VAEEIETFEPPGAEARELDLGATRIPSVDDDDPGEAVDEEELEGGDAGDEDAVSSAVAMASRPPEALTFEREEDAAAQLDRAGQRAAFLERAAWLRE